MYAATIDVPPEKRKRLVGTGGHRIKALVAETGADVQSVGDESMSVFAPTREIMDDVMEKIEAISAEPLMVRIILAYSLLCYTVEPPLLRTPWGPGEVSCIERCPHFRGKFILRKHIRYIAKCP